MRSLRGATVLLVGALVVLAWEGGALFGRGTVRWLPPLFTPPSASAQPSMGTGTFRCPDIWNGTTHIGEACKLVFDANDYTIVRNGNTVTFTLGSRVTELGQFIGDITGGSDFYNPMTSGAIDIDFSAATKMLTPTVPGWNHTAVGDCGYDSASKLWKCGDGVNTQSYVAAVSPTTKTIAAVSDSISSLAATGLPATVVLLSDATGHTLTSAPTVSNGQDGQVLTLVSVGAGTVTVQDQGTLANSNIRLGAASRALGTRDSLTLVYSSTIGDWVEVGFVNVL